MEKLYNVGKIVNTHSIRGELKIVPLTDFPDVRFAKGSELVIADPAKGIAVPVTVERARAHQSVYIVKFAEFDNINQVEKYKGTVLKVSERHLVELDEDEYYYHEIIGCTVVDEDGHQLGTIEEILKPGANDVWVVKRPKGKPILLPCIDDVVLDVDVPARKVTVRLMEGLAD